MPKQQEWVTLAQWAKEYGTPYFMRCNRIQLVFDTLHSKGDLVYLNGLGQSILVINSATAAYELFEKRSSIYSDRGEFPMVKDLFVCGLLHFMNHVDPAHGWCRMGWDWAVTIMRYGELWRRHRKIIHQKFHPTAVEEYYPVQIKHARYTFPLISQQMYLTGNSLLLQRLHETPDDFVDHVRHNSGAIIMEACCSPFYSLFFFGKPSNQLSDRLWNQSASKRRPLYCHRRECYRWRHCGGKSWGIPR